MNSNLINTGILAGIFLLMFLTSEILYHKFKIKAEYTRKYTHLATGLLALLFPVMVNNHWYILFLCGSFFFILITSMQLNFLKSINAVDRKTKGSLLYPIVVYGLFLIYQNYMQSVFYYLPILILAICDPIAGLTGKKWPIGEYHLFGKTKTLLGSSFFFVSALITSLSLLIFVEGTPFIEALFLSIIISSVTTVAEAFSHGGYDNFTIPGTAVLLLVIAKEYYTFF